MDMPAPPLLLACSVLSSPAEILLIITWVGSCDFIDVVGTDYAIGKEREQYE
jgi:hypothetical protein